MHDFIAGTAFPGCGAFIGGASKFSSFKTLAETLLPEVTAYKAVMFLDDDITFTFEDVDRLFECASHLQLDLSQASLSRNSFLSWSITQQAGGFYFRYTNFVEIMMPIMSQHALSVCLSTFGKSLSGWGLDFVWPKLLGYPRNRIAIIDDISGCHHKPVDIHEGLFYRYLRDRGIDPVTEAKAILSDYDIDPVDMMPINLAAILKT